MKSDRDIGTAGRAALLASGPFLGLLYAVFLPFIGIAMLLAVVGKKIFGGLLGAAHRGAAFGWKPSEAYLAGRKAKKEEKEK